jgi:hypothetical protein
VDEGDPVVGRLANIEVRRSGPARLTDDRCISSGCMVDLRAAGAAIAGGGEFTLNLANELLILLMVGIQEHER